MRNLNLSLLKNSALYVQMSINLYVICIFYMFLLDFLKFTIDFLMEIAYGVNTIFYDYHKEKDLHFI